MCIIYIPTIPLIMLMAYGFNWFGEKKAQFGSKYRSLRNTKRKFDESLTLWIQRWHNVAHPGGMIQSTYEHYHEIHMIKSGVGTVCCGGCHQNQWIYISWPKLLKIVGPASAVTVSLWTLMRTGSVECLVRYTIWSGSRREFALRWLSIPN